jgi:hypothetical protein
MKYPFSPLLRRYTSVIELGRPQSRKIHQVICGLRGWLKLVRKLAIDNPGVCDPCSFPPLTLNAPGATCLDQP